MTPTTQPKTTRSGTSHSTSASELPDIKLPSRHRFGVLLQSLPRPKLGFEANQVIVLHIAAKLAAEDLAAARSIKRSTIPAFASGATEFLVHELIRASRRSGRLPKEAMTRLIANLAKAANLPEIEAIAKLIQVVEGTIKMIPAWTGPRTFRINVSPGVDQEAPAGKPHRSKIGPKTACEIRIALLKNYPFQRDTALITRIAKEFKVDPKSLPAIGAHLKIAAAKQLNISLTRTPRGEKFMNDLLVLFRQELESKGAVTAQNALFQADYQHVTIKHERLAEDEVNKRLDKFREWLGIKSA